MFIARAGLDPRDRPGPDTVLLIALLASLALHVALALLPLRAGPGPLRAGAAPLHATLVSQVPRETHSTQPGSFRPSRKSVAPAAGRAPEPGPPDRPHASSRAPAPTAFQIQAGAILDPTQFQLDYVQWHRGSAYHHYGSNVLRGPPAFPDLRVTFPPEALARGDEGLVLVRLFISETGHIDHAETLCRDMHFEAAVTAALADARFRPGDGLRGPEKSVLLVEFPFVAPLPPGAEPQSLERRFEQLRDACRDKARETRTLLERQAN